MSTWLAIRLLRSHSRSHFTSFTCTHKKQVSSRGGEGEASASNSSQVQPSAEESQPEVTFWQEVMDANTNHVYYWNPETNEVTWTLPANGVIANEVPGSGGGGGDDGGMGTENSTNTGAAAESKTKSDKVASAQKETAKSSTTKKVAKKAEIDMFESPMEEGEEPSSIKKKPTEETQAASAAVAVATTEQERSSSKIDKASPEPTDSSANNKPSGKKNVIFSNPSMRILVNAYMK